MHSAPFDEPVHLVEQRRHLLDLVDDDLAVRAWAVRGGRFEFLSQPLGSGGVTAESDGCVCDDDEALAEPAGIQLSCSSEDKRVSVLPTTH